MVCHCSGVGSKANWNACSVQPSGTAYLRAIVLEHGHRPGRPMGGGTPAVEPDAEAGQDLGHVSDQVIVDLGRIDYHQSPALGGECSLHLLGPEPRQAVPGSTAEPGTSDAFRSGPSQPRSEGARRRAPPGLPKWRHAPPADPDRDADPQRT